MIHFYMNENTSCCWIKILYFTFITNSIWVSSSKELKLCVYLSVNSKNTVSNIQTDIEIFISVIRIEYIFGQT